MIVHLQLMLVLLLAVSHASDAPVSWTANWIWQDADGPPNTWLCFRKEFTLNEMPAATNAHIAVDSKYWLYINDSLVVFEGGLNRGPTPSSGYFDTVDIQPYVVEGENCIAVLVWYWGNDGRNNIDSGQGGLLFQAEMGDFILTSDSSWKIKAHPAYGYVPFTLNDGNRFYLYGGWNIGFDARLDMPGWYKKEYDDALWFPAVEKGVPPCEPWNELVERPIPQWHNSGLVDYVNADLFPEISDGRPIFAELPYNAQVTPYLKINAPPGLLIKIETDHYDVGGYYGHRTEYITKNGVQEFESFAWQNGEQVIYDIPAGVKILELKYRETGYDTEFAGSFECDDPFYNRLFEKAARTLYVCMRDNFMDCPDRERGAWIGDVATYIPQSFTMLDRRSDLLTLKTIDEFINWRDGPLLKGLAPGSDLTEYASQSLNAVSDVGIVLTYYRHTGDLAPILRSYDAIKEYLLVWQLHDTGLITPRATWNGQGRNVDHILIENTWYYMAVKAAKIMAQLTGRTADVAVFQEKMALMAANFDDHFWQGDIYRSGAFVDDRANGLVVLAGLASADKYAAITYALRRTKYSGPYMEGYILQALFEMRQPTIAQLRMKERYHMMVNSSNYTTLWEAFWRIGSSNHAWSGAPVTSLFKYVAGIDPITPGYETFQVYPQMGMLNDVSVVVPSIRGNIHVAIHRQESRFIIDLQSPPQTTAIVGLPRDAFVDTTINAIQANGNIIWRRGSYLGGDAHFSWEGEDDNYIKFKVNAGEHHIAALRAPLAIEMKQPPDDHVVIKNYPNPFNAATTITMNNPKPGHATVHIFDTRGHVVCRLFDGYLAGEKNILWTGENEFGQSVASGVYTVQFKSHTEKTLKKILLIR